MSEDIQRRREDVIKKIKKCLALSKSSNPNEAAIAMRQAQKLMQEHNISESVIDLPRIVASNRIRSQAVSRPKDYETWLMHIVKDSFGCALWFNMGNSYGAFTDEVYGSYTYLGPEHQVAVASWTASYLLNRLRKARVEYTEMARFAASERLGVSEFRVKQSEVSKELDAFCLGWVHAISKKVVEFANPEAVQAEIDRQLKQALGGDLEESRKIKSKQSFNGATRASLQLGKLAGDGESIHRPMNGNQAEGRQELKQQKYLTHN